MTLSRRVSVFLLAFGVWSWVIWPTFLRNIWKDPRSFDAAGGMTGFLTAHLLLAVTSIALGTAVGSVGWRGFAASRNTASRNTDALRRDAPSADSADGVSEGR